MNNLNTTVRYVGSKLQYRETLEEDDQGYIAITREYVGKHPIWNKIRNYFKYGIA